MNKKPKVIALTTKTLCKKCPMKHWLNPNECKDYGALKDSDSNYLKRAKQCKIDFPGVIVMTSTEMKGGKR